MAFSPKFTLFTGDLTSDAMTHLPGRIENRRFCTAVIGGFLDAGFTYYARESHLWEWVNFLGYRGCFYNRAANKCWEGFVHTVTLHLDAASVTYSLEKLCNRTRMVYTKFTGTGTGGLQLTTAWAEDTDSQDLYGIHEIILSGSELTDAVADSQRDSYLNLYKRPFPVRNISIGKEGRKTLSAEIQLRGYWTTAAWQVYWNATDTDADTGTQIQYVLTTDCPKISTDYSHMLPDSSGLTGLATWQLRDQNMTAQDEILRLMGMGDGTYHRLVGGVYEDREFYLAQANEDIKYRSKRAGDVIYDQYGQPVDPWDVRPDGMILVEDLEPTGTSFTSNLDDPRLMYVERIEYREPGTVEIFPLGHEDLATIITSMGMGWHGG